MKVPEPVIPSGIPKEHFPDLLRNWHLGSRARRYLSRRRFQEVTNLLHDGPRGRVLDAGCGWGYNLFLLARNGFGPFGIDIVQNDFHAAREIARVNSYDPGLAGADMSALPFISNAFVAVSGVETFEHIFEPDRMNAVREAWRVLAPGGMLALSTPNYFSIVEFGKRVITRFPHLKRLFPKMCYPAKDIGRGEYHPYRYHKPVPARALRAMLEEAGFVVVSMRSIIFIWKNVPDWLFPTAKLGESLLERTPVVRLLGSTLLVLAKKPS